jgi:hypothetical protein
MLRRIVLLTALTFGLQGGPAWAQDDDEDKSVVLAGDVVTALLPIVA